jgi:hypothetical protein
MGKTNKKTESQHNQHSDDRVPRERHVFFVEKYSDEPTEKDYCDCYQAFHAHESIAVRGIETSPFFAACEGIIGDRNQRVRHGS